MPGHRFVARLILCQSWLYFHLNFTHCRHAFLPKTVNTTGTGMMDLLNQLSLSSLTCQPQHLAYRPHWIQLMSCSQELLCIFWSPDPDIIFFTLASSHFHTGFKRQSSLNFDSTAWISCNFNFVVLPTVGLSLQCYSSCCF